jgi:hypothetical protein
VGGCRVGWFAAFVRAGFRGRCLWTVAVSFRPLLAKVSPQPPMFAAVLAGLVPAFPLDIGFPVGRVFVCDLTVI